MTKKILLNSIFYLILILLLTVSYTKDTFVNLLSSPDQIAQIGFISKNKGYILRNLNNGTLVLYNFTDGKELITVTGSYKISFNNFISFETENLDFIMKYNNSQIIMDDTPQWTMVYLDDFQGNAMGWSKEKLSTCGTNDNMFLGGHCNLGGEEVSKKFANLPQHTMIRITANFHFFDKWEGEEGYMKFNGEFVWADEYKWCDKVMLWYCKKYAINACGAEYPDRLSVPIDFTTFHHSSEFTLTFGSDLTKSPCDAAWGIDDVTVYVK